MYINRSNLTAEPNQTLERYTRIRFVGNYQFDLDVSCISVRLYNFFFVYLSLVFRFFIFRVERKWKIILPEI